MLLSGRMLAQHVRFLIPFSERGEKKDQGQNKNIYFCHVGSTLGQSTYQHVQDLGFDLQQH